MSFRRKLLAALAATVIVSVVAVAWTVSALTREAFERANEERTDALVTEFRREFNRRGEEVERRIQAIAESDAVARVALALNRASPDYGAYLNEARTLADGQQLDFLELVDGQGTIVSSAQWPAKFGYKDASLPATPPRQAFLREEDLPDGAALGLCAMRQAGSAENPLYVIGGRRLDKNFLATLDLPAGTRAMFYQNLGGALSTQFLIDPSGSVQQPERLAPLIEEVRAQSGETEAVVHWSSDPADDETVHALPLNGQDGHLLGILLVATSRRPYIELRQRIRSAALLAGAGGIFLAIVLSGWVAGRVTRPVEQLAQAAREVAAGNWHAQVPVASSDELGELAEAFNRMTGELMEQRERLLQSERVAAWRELARRLAHELKNPLFPLQLTVENLVRARQQSPELFEEMFQESAATLLAEINNLKAIVSRFSEFSRMPQPRFERVQANELVQNVARLFQAQLHAPERAAPIECRLELGQNVGEMAGDGELLHRALSNLILNAMDAMPQGGTLALRTRGENGRVVIEIADSGAGLTAEECEHLFTPYYTSKIHGTGLGLAIVQSVISDHGGRITVRSQPGSGTTFAIELPRNLEKLNAAARDAADSAS
ncbi:MAG TPA: ATP-binding protein [Terriglobales bacterium]|nr:ATP-binding protein [Terriglobales bacterium]